MTGLSKHSGNYNLSPIAKAMTAKKILNHLPHEIKAMVYWCCGQLGMEEQPDSQVFFSTEFMTMHCGKYTIDELKLAFTMFSKGEIDLKISTKTISPKLIGAIMNGYEKHKHQEVMRMRRIRDEKEEKQKARPTPESYERAFDDVVKHIETHNEIPIWSLFSFIYEHIRLQEWGWYGLDDKAQTNTLKQEYKEKVIAELKQESKNAKSSIQQQQARRALNNDDLIKYECRSRYAKQFINEKYLKS